MPEFLRSFKKVCLTIGGEFPVFDENGRILGQDPSVVLHTLRVLHKTQPDPMLLIAWGIIVATSVYFIEKPSREFGRFTREKIFGK